MPDHVRARLSPASPPDRRLPPVGRERAPGEGRLDELGRIANASPSRSGNLTGLSDALKSGLEAVSGFSLDEVRVHRGSAAPAAIGAMAFARGTHIHLGPGQERHLPHEAWHVVQQMQGRVTSRGRLADGAPYNADPALEREADEMGALARRAAPSGRALIRGAPPGDAPVQGAWRFTLSDNRGVAFWLDEPGDPQERPAKPTAWAKYVVIDAADAPEYYLAETRPRRGLEPALTIAQWTTLYGKPSRKSPDTYNPFGRFSTEGVTSFVPGRSLVSERREALEKLIAEKEGTYQACDAERTEELRKMYERDYPKTKFHTAQGYPAMVVTVEGRVLGFVGADEFAAIYADSGRPRGRAQPDPDETTPASKLTWREDVPDTPEYMHAVASNIDASTLASWRGKERDKQQGQVMGLSAAAAAQSAGFDPKEGDGWEWLHLVAHGMGGIDEAGPQVAQNLVAGTSECNSQMIVVEEVLKDIVTKSDGHAKLSIYVSMFDKARHIGDFITYDFVMHADKGEPIAVYHYRFDCLSRNRPLVMQNRVARYAAREVFGVATPGENEGLSIPAPTVWLNKHDPAAVRTLPGDRIDAAVKAMSTARLKDVAEMLGADADVPDADEVAKRLALQPFDLVLDIVAKSVTAPDPVNHDPVLVDQRINDQLKTRGMERQATDRRNFISLIDAIHDQLERGLFAVEKDELIASVRELTGSQDGHMLEIIGAEGDQVLAAIDELIFEKFDGHHILVANVTIAMHDGTLVRFDRANVFEPPDAKQHEIELDLLFVNNNHYESLKSASSDPSSSDSDDD